MGTRFLWDPVEDNIVKELDDSNATIADYTTEPYLYGDLISQDRDGQSRFYHFDGLGSTMELTDSSGNVTDTRRYSAFGTITFLDGVTQIPHLFIGQMGYRSDLPAEHLLVRHRIYSSRHARWQSADPLLADHATESNAYLYAENTPTMLVDPAGQIPIFKDPRPFPPRRPRLKSTVFSVSCAGCGLAAMQWMVSATDVRISRIVQEICFEVSIVECELVDECCKGATRHYCRQCYYEELFRYSDSLPIQGIDFWKIPSVHSYATLGCGQRGTARISSTIRAFEPREGDFTLDKMTEGKGKVACGQFSIQASDFSLSRPMWWNMHVAEVTSSMNSVWKCCGGDGNKSSMSYSSSTGRAGSSDCKDPIDPRIFPQPRI